MDILSTDARKDVSRAIALLASEYGVSETTIKKGIRIIQAAQSNQIVTHKE